MCFLGKSNRARCVVCEKEFVAEKIVIKNHSIGVKHKQKLSEKASANTRRVTDFLQSSSTSETFKNDVKTTEIKLAGFFAEHNIAFLAADHLTKLLKSCLHDSKIMQEVSFGRTKATQICTNVIGKYQFEKLREIIKVNKFSVLIDESTDVGCVKTMCICIRFYDDSTKKVETKLWSLVQIFDKFNAEAANAGATGERLFDTVIESFTSENVPTKNIIGFASDGCNTMMGVNNSVSSRLRIMNPGIIILKCICHSLHLCSSEACKHLPRACEDLARDVYNFFKNSAKRICQFAEFQHFCNVEPHKLLRPAQTRWLSLLAVVQRILEQWEPLRMFFELTAKIIKC